MSWYLSNYFRAIFGAEVEHDVKNSVVDGTSDQLESLWCDGVYHPWWEEEEGRRRRKARRGIKRERDEEREGGREMERLGERKRGGTNRLGSLLITHNATMFQTITGI